MSVKELIRKASLQRCQVSIVLYFDISEEERRDIRYFTRKEIVDSLNANGRRQDPITWVEGWCKFDEDFPLDLMFGKTEYWRIIGYCYIPKF